MALNADSWLQRELRISSTCVLSPKQDIYTTPCQAPPMLPKKEQKIPQSQKIGGRAVRWHLSGMTLAVRNPQQLCV